MARVMQRVMSEKSDANDEVLPTALISKFGETLCNTAMDLALGDVIENR